MEKKSFVLKGNIVYSGENKELCSIEGGYVVCENGICRGAFEKLPEQWQEFCKKISENGESFAAFLHTVPSVEINGRMLILQLSNSFYADWVMQPGNRASLANIISYYADVPVGFQIQAALTDGAKKLDKDAMEKMERRYL